MVSTNQANCLPFTRTYEHIHTRAHSFSRSYDHYVKRTWIILFFSFDILFTPVFVPYNYWFPKSYIKLRMNAEESVQKDEILTIKWDFVRFSLYKLAQLFAQWYRFSSLAAGKRVSFNTHHFFSRGWFSTEELRETSPSYCVTKLKCLQQVVYMH